MVRVKKFFCWNLETAAFLIGCANILFSAVLFVPSDGESVASQYINNVMALLRIMAAVVLIVGIIKVRIIF